MVASAVDLGDWEEWEPAAKARLKWLLEARPEQLTPEGEWLIWAVVTGRGWGKTRSGGEDVFDYGRENPGTRIAVVAPTFTDGRDVCMEGESGLLSVVPAEFIESYHRSMGQLTLKNKTQYQVFSAEKPNRLRGPQHHRAWCDELAAWKYLQETWDMLMFGLRLGERPQVVITTTPRPRPLLINLMTRPTTHVTTGTTYDNIANLARSTVDELQRVYAGTRLGKQELEGILLESVEGALWQRDVIEENRADDTPLNAGRTVVAIDPAVTVTEYSDETGIVVAMKTKGGCRKCGTAEDHAFVLDDRSIKASPDMWCRRAVVAYRDYTADRIVAETNNGGDMVEVVLRTIDKTLPFKKLHASKGKRTRAEPVAALYEQGRVHHVGYFDTLEDQMCTWDPETTTDSPDRLDALVWAITELMIGGVNVSMSIAPGGSRSPSYWKQA